MERKVISKAICSCNRVIQSSDAALNQSKGVKNLGVADFLDGGFFLSLFKHGTFN